MAKKKIITALFLSFLLVLLPFFPAWLWSPSSYIDTTHRYLTMSTTGVTLLMATIISLGKTSKNQFFLALSFSLFLVTHIISTQTYINKLLASHSQHTVDNIWSAIPHIPEIGKIPVILYFERDESNGSILGDSVMFGFPFHIALLYNLSESDIFPATMQDWQEVISATQDGQSLKPHGYPLKPIPINQVYAFRLHGKNTLINITDTMRDKLSGQSK